MIETSLHLENEEQYQRLLRDFDRTLDRYLRKAGKQSAYVIQAKAQRYPPPPPDSSYRRTGTLGRRWAVTGPTATVSEVKTIVENPTSYGPFVMGETEQAAVHRGRWPTTQRLIEEAEAQVVGLHQAAIDDAIKEVSR